MIGKNILTKYNFQDIEEYFEMVIESRVNGNFKQCKDQYKKLSSKQKEEFKTWFITYNYYDALDNETTAEKEYLKFIQFVNK